MKNLFKLSVFALLLAGVSIAQQEVSPDHFDAEPAKQPVKVKRVVKSSQPKMAQTKQRASKPSNKTMAVARVSGN